MAVSALESCTCTKNNALAGFVIFMWMFLNFALNFFNKWAFTKTTDGGGGFTFPIFYTMWNTFASFLGANLLMVLVPANRTISWKQFVDNKFALLVFGVVFSSNIVTNNASLVHISLSVNQVIKCLVPIPAIIFSYFIEKKTYSYPVLAAAGVLTFGACMSIPYDSPKVTLLGSVLALWSTAMSGLRPVLTALLLKNSKESGLTPVPLLWYDAAFSTIFLFFAYLVSDETLTVAGYFVDYGYGRGVSILVGGSFMAFAYNIVVFYLVKVTSSLTSVVLANLKTTLIIVIAVLLWDKTISWISVLGFVIFFSGLFAYSYLTFKSRQKSSATKPTEATSKEVEPPKEPTKAPSKETTRLVS
jgi:drug/metabolite transporter (DMT)-like permease